MPIAFVSLWRELWSPKHVNNSAAPIHDHTKFFAVPRCRVSISIARAINDANPAIAAMAHNFPALAASDAIVVVSINHDYGAWTMGTIRWFWY